MTLDVPSLAGRLIRLDRVARSAPTNVLNAYIRIAEATLTSAVEDRVAELEREQWRFEVVERIDPLDVIMPLATEVRATDLLLRRLRPREAPSSAHKSYRYPAEGAFVIPCRERRLGQSGRDRQGYERRGLLQHRILPLTCGGYKVRLWGGGAVAAKATVGMPSFRGGAALFEDLDIKVDGVPGSLFTVSAVEAPDKAGCIERALMAAHTEGCSAVIWPELTMSPADRKTVSKWLENRLFKDVPEDAALDFVVAGTWHQRVRGKMRNRGIVFDKNGDLLLPFDKMIAYHNPKWGTEDITPSSTVEILILEDLLIGFGICRDFAETQPRNPFLGLDIDLAVIPSLGNQRTVEAHAIVAQLLESRFTTQTFVVQQSDPDLSEQRGFVVLNGASSQQVTEFEAYGGLSRRDTASNS